MSVVDATDASLGTTNCGFVVRTKYCYWLCLCVQAAEMEKCMYFHTKLELIKIARDAERIFLLF